MGVVEGRDLRYSYFRISMSSRGASSADGSTQPSQMAAVWIAVEGLRDPAIARLSPAIER